MPDRPTPEPGESLTADGTSFQQIFETYYRSVFGFFVARGVGVARAVPPAEPRAVDARKSRPVFAEQVEELMDRHRAEPGRGYDVKAFEIAERARTDGLADIFGARPEPLSLREIQRGLLDRDTLLLDYFLGERQSTLWVVSSTSMSAYALPPCSTIEDAARKTYALLARGYIRESAVRLDLALSSLGEMLLGPVEGQLAGKTLIVVADGALRLLPFATLTTARNPSAPLVSDHQIVNLPSASSLALLRRRMAARDQPTRQIAVIADPVFTAEDPRAGNAPAGLQPGSFPRLVRLPYSGFEAQQILALFPPQERFSAIGFAANRQTVLTGRLHGYRIVHFATHTILDPESPQRSGLVLSAIDEDGRPQEALLRGSEVDRLNLNADLVVLSSCSPGTVDSGEDGMMPLARHFFRAGASRVLVSVWNASDRATAELMRRFYTSLLKEGLSPAAALRNAQQSMRGEAPLSAPYYWAGFSLYGDWK